ncbi:hypothetical protein QJS10_CPB15g00776 [Acorus calamus]|uniref:DAGKc domain-containing protein n=1 Tax=Acorus calamus TaxID=4465 RepID=A0AAV9D6D8_ACOCL|nr:hypothetical protein QJS10_CPB15g00776 [Acorus calamus]
MVLYGIVVPLPKPSFTRSEQTIISFDPSTNRMSDAASRRRRGDYVFVVNPKGANGRTGKEWKKLLPYLRSRVGGDCNICESITSGPSHAIDITREAIREGVDAVIAVGGDGTLHEVVNGFFWEGKPVLAHDQGAKRSTALGIIPLGTGSDFARTFCWKNDPHEAIERIATACRSAMAGYYAGRYKRFGNLCYVFGALRAFMGHRNQDLKIKVDGGEWEVYSDVTALCIGNAKYFGGGMKITPTADPCSRNLEVDWFYAANLSAPSSVVILQNFKWYDFVLKLHKLYRGTHLSEENVHLRSAKERHHVDIKSINPSRQAFLQQVFRSNFIWK